MKNQTHGTASLAGKFTSDLCGEEHTTTIFGEECSASLAGKFTTDACGEEHTTTIFGEECSALPPGRQKAEGGPFGAY